MLVCTQREDDVRGRWVALSIPRRIVTDLMYFSAGLPWIVAQRTLMLRGVAAARAAHVERPPWTALFAKAYALVAAEFPELRRAYVRLPWPHLYEYKGSVASIAVERSFDGEMGVAFVHIGEPAALPVGEIGRLIRDAKQDSFAGTKRFRRMVRIASLPLPLRRAVWWFALNLARLRANHFGTFGISTVTALDTEILQPRSPLTTVVTYGMIGGDGSVTVRVVFDHRVLDAMTLARALGRLEEILNGPIADELRGGAVAQA